MPRALYRIYMQHVQATFTKIERKFENNLEGWRKNSWYFFFSFLFDKLEYLPPITRIAHTHNRVKIISTGSHCIDVNLKKMEGRRESSSAYPSRQVNYHLSNVPISVQVCITRRGGGKENDTMENRASDIKDIYLASGRERETFDDQTAPARTNIGVSSFPSLLYWRKTLTTLSTLARRTRFTFDYRSRSKSTRQEKCLA